LTNAAHRQIALWNSGHSWRLPDDAAPGAAAAGVLE
jgi:hypothetical protein